MLSKLLESTDLNLDEIQSNVWAFLHAGHETTATALAWIMFHLAKYPNYQRMVHEEIVKYIGKDATVDDQNIKQLEFLDMFIKEVLRIRPPLLTTVIRKTEKDTTICGHLIPAGFQVLPGLGMLPHLDEFWEDPTKFDPYRFSAENSVGRHPYAYIPFYAGRRSCIGSNFSLIEQKVVITMLLQRFSFHYVEESMPEEYGIFAYPKHVRVIVKHRE